MSDDIISKLLKFFCIDESGEESIEPSSESMLIFSFLLVGSVVFAASGQYLQIIPATICFIVSAASFGMTCLALLAIILGYNRRRNYRLLNRAGMLNDLNVAGTTDAKPSIARRSIHIDIEIDFLDSSCNAGRQQQLMNPSCMDNTSEHNPENDPWWMVPSWRDESLDESDTDSYEDFEEQESDDYDSSESWSTTNYHSFSENDVSSLSEEDENDFVSFQDGGWNTRRN